MRRTLTAILLACLCTLTAAAQSGKPGTFSAGDGTFLLNGQPIVVKAAELHYPRIPRPYWEHRIKMCKALGMNTICLYVFWNIHEQREGAFDFSGNNDVAAFCRLAQKNGMYVIVRPGPYVCAEWEMGGLPWWLLKKKDIRLRERDPYFLERVKTFEAKVGEQLSGLTIQHGGPIIMIQVENEYGSYGVDKAYVSEIRDCLRSIYGDDMALFQCDWSSNFERNGLDDLVWTMNFGTGANIDQQFRRLGELRPSAPKMCSEFWSGWFDKWGARHETRAAKDMVEGMDEMLSKGISFSLYMTHGGTSFGHWAGANSPGFAPDVTSYDYDAPINEYGHATEKFQTLRTMMAKYSDGGRPLPSIPRPPMDLITVPEFTLDEYAPIECGLVTAAEDAAAAALRTRQSDRPLTMEEMDNGWGFITYTTELPALTAPSTLIISDPHDFAQVFVDGKYVGKADRVKNENSVQLPAVREGARLTILVEAMGRINFGRAIKDYKGITNTVTLQTQGYNGCAVTYEPKSWTVSAYDDEYATALRAFDRDKARQVAKAKGEAVPAFELENSRAGYYRGHFNLKRVGDTFLDFETWGKGQVYVNGHALGRIWSIGPQQTLYVPGCWLKKGQNEVIVLDVVGPRSTKVWGQDKPEYDKLQLESSNKHNNPGDRPDLNSATPALTAQFAAGNGWQKMMLPAAAKGRQLCIEVASTQRSGDVTAIAELYALGADGQRLSREPWTTKYADSEDENGNHTGDKVYDLQESTYWQTVRGTALPHLLVIDLGGEQTVTGIEYLPRAEQGAPGSVKDFKVFLR